MTSVQDAVDREGTGTTATARPVRWRSYGSLSLDRGVGDDADRPSGPLLPPPVPRSIPDTGLSREFLLKMLLKTMHSAGAETTSELAGHLKLSPAIVIELMDLARKRLFTESLGVQGTEVRYGLTTTGRQRAQEALGESQYLGPVPVPLVVYQQRIEQQRNAHGTIDHRQLEESLAHLILPDDLRHQLGPALNTGAPVLLYGDPGNGKSSIAVAMAKLMKEPVHVPHCVEVDGQLIKVFDPTIHHPIGTSSASEELKRRIASDQRWVACRRPVMVTGGELTLQMLDLQLEPSARFYDAPLQLKAANGMFILDDFGRQIVRPSDMLNRWLLPLEHRIDYLTLHTGKRFMVPFDVLVIFSTNLPPNELMDAAMMRRVPFKIAVMPPSPAEYEEIFRQVCISYGIEMPEDIVAFLFEAFYGESGVALARYQPRFIVEHVLARCHYDGSLPCLEQEAVLQAARHLYVPQDG